MEIRHKVFNPKLQSLESVLTTEPIENDWMLLNVIPVTEYEWVAIFEKTTINIKAEDSPLPTH